MIMVEHSKQLRVQHFGPQVALITQEVAPWTIFQMEERKRKWVNQMVQPR